MNRACSPNDLVPNPDCFICVGGNHLSSRRDRNPASITPKDADADPVFQIPDLFAERRLGDEEPRGRSREVGRCGNGGCTSDV
jgi:hypothetical protein